MLNSLLSLHIVKPLSILWYPGTDLSIRFRSRHAPWQDQLFICSYLLILATENLRHATALWIFGGSIASGETGYSLAEARSDGAKETNCCQPVRTTSNI